jgi:hypothetical protein
MAGAQPGDRQQAALRVAFRDLQQLCDGVLLVQMQRRDAGAVATGMQRQLKVPYGRENRALQSRLVERLVALDARQIWLVARNYQQRHIR